MSSAAIIAIAIVAVVILAALAFITLARRSDVRGAGALSAETRKRDAAGRESRPADEVVDHAPTRQEAERAGELARYGTSVDTVQETAVAPRPLSSKFSFPLGSPWIVKLSVKGGVPPERSYWMMP